MIGALTRTWTLFELGQAILALVRGRTTMDTLPTPSAMARLQAAAFNADGLPRLAARFFSSYTETSATVAIPADELSQNLLLTDLRLLTTVGRAAGFAIGQDMNWVIDCATVLAADALADRPPPAAPIQVDGSSAPEIAHDLLHLMGQEHLVSGQHRSGVAQDRRPVGGHRRRRDEEAPPGHRSHAGRARDRRPVRPAHVGRLYRRPPGSGPFVGSGWQAGDVLRLAHSAGPRGACGYQRSPAHRTAPSAPRTYRIMAGWSWPSAT